MGTWARSQALWEVLPAGGSLNCLRLPDTLQGPGRAERARARTLWRCHPDPWDGRGSGPGQED